MSNENEFTAIELAQTSSVPQHGSSNETTTQSPSENEDELRRIFRLKVISILIIQMISSAFVILFCAFVIKDYSRSDTIFRIDLLLVFLSAIIILIIFALSKIVRVTTYYNYFILAVFTYGIAYAIGVVCARRSEIEVIIALVASIAIAALLIRYAIHTNMNLADQVNVLLISLLILMLTMMETIFSYYPNIVTNIVLGVLSLPICCIYLIVAVQLARNTNEKCKLSTDEYILTALFTYLITVYFYLRIWIVVTSIFQLFEDDL